MQPIHLRNVPPPGETFNHPAFFEHLFQWLRPERYLELGVREGSTFNKVAQYCGKAIAVDLAPAPFGLQPNMEYHAMSTDEYFNRLDPSVMFDAVFIDADHSHAQSLKDFMNVKDRIIEDGFIFLHDTYPYDPCYFDMHACNDVYKTALYIKQNFIDEFEVLTLPINPGVTMVKRISRKQQLVYMSENDEFLPEKKQEIIPIKKEEIIPEKQEISGDKIIKKNFLVLSDYNWLPLNLEESWLSKYTDNYLIYDRAGRWEETDKIKRQINVGQNIYDLFDFIETHYDNLPEVTIFGRAAIFFPKDDGTKTRPSNGTCSEEFFMSICNNETFTEVHDFGPEVHNGSSSFYGPEGSFNEINNSWYFGPHPPRFFGSLNDFLLDVYVDPILPAYIRFAPGGSYIIPKANMLKYSKNFYSKMKELVGYDVITGEAHMLERALYTIFTCNYAVKEKYR